MDEHWYLKRLASRGAASAFVSDGRTVTYDRLYADVLQWRQRLDQHGIGRGDVVVLVGDHSPENFAILLALTQRKCISVPLTALPEQLLDERCDMAGADFVIDTLSKGSLRVRQLEPQLQSSLLRSFRSRQRAGLILFSSGSSGTPKTCLLDMDSLCGMGLC